MTSASRRAAQSLPSIEWGDRAQPTVVLLHGMLGSAEYWRQIAERLPGRRVIALDLLGFGRAPRPADAAYDYHDHCTAVLATLDRLGVDDSATLVGHSMGALIALRLAAERPERFGRLVLIGMPVFESAAAARAAIGSTWLRRLLLYGPGSWLFCSMWCQALKPFSRRLAPLYLRTVPPAVAGGTVDHTWRSYSASLANIVEDQRVAADLERLSCPTVIVYGDTDRDASAAATWADVPGMAVVMLPGGHQLPLVIPDAIVDLIVASEVHPPSWGGL